MTNEELIAKLQQDNALLRLEVKALKADTPEEKQSWLQMKAERQRAALDILNKRVVVQRFQLRTLNEMGRGLTREEWLEIKKQHENDSRLVKFSEDLLVV